MHARASTATWTGSGSATWAPAVRSRRGRARPRGRVVREWLGPYQVQALLGEGGMASVYLAEHSLMGRRVAIKRLAPVLARHPEAHAMFLREARIAATVRHPNLADVYDFGSDADGNPYFVMELVAGETLASRLERGPLLMSQCFDVGILLAEAVAAIHDAGYVHRDVKAENVMLARDGRRLVPKLIDFGIARRLGPGDDDPDGAPLEEGLVGTPRAMAPEQVAREPVDERTDVWALGVVLYEMICARVPFDGGGSVRDELLAIVTDPPRPLPVHVDAGMRAVVEACLCKEPAGRPAGALALARQLRAAQAAYLERRGMAGRAGGDDRRHRGAARALAG